MGWLFAVIACVLFFLAAVGSAIIPNPTSWGLFFLSLAIAFGGYFPYASGWTRKP